MDGLEVVNALGKRVNNIPVVITTASRDEHLATEIFKHGVANLVTKDTDLNYLNTLSEVAINSVERFRYEAKNHELQEQLNKQVAEIESLEISIRKFNEELVQNN
jgi:DNA-binding NtrC family response regulator